MRKIYFLLLMYTTLGIFGVMAAPNKNIMVLDSVNGSDVSGIAIIRTIPKDGFYDVNIQVRTENLFPETGRIYEVWLIDENIGYKLSIGSFKTRNNGKGTFRSSENIVNPFIYDKIVITKEPINDVNPNPDNSILEGEILGSIRDVITLIAKLNNKEEVPITKSRAEGLGIFEVNTSEDTINFDISHKDLEGIEVGSHLHGFSIKGENSEILFTLPLGIEKQGVIDYSTLSDREGDIIAGLTYVNIHSDIYPNGEIRGQILFMV